MPQRMQPRAAVPPWTSVTPTANLHAVAFVYLFTFKHSTSPFHKNKRSEDLTYKHLSASPLFVGCFSTGEPHGQEQTAWAGGRQLELMQSFTGNTAEVIWKNDYYFFFNLEKVQSLQDEFTSGGEGLCTTCSIFSVFLLKSILPAIDICRPKLRSPEEICNCVLAWQSVTLCNVILSLLLLHKTRKHTSVQMWLGESWEQD